MKKSRLLPLVEFLYTPPPWDWELSSLSLACESVFFLFFFFKDIQTFGVISFLKKFRLRNFR